MTTVCTPDRSTPGDDAASNAVSIRTTHSIKDYFRTAVCDAVQQEHVDVSEDTLWYLTQLFSNYHRSDRLFDFDASKRGSPTRPLTPLAEYYRLAAESDSAKERRLYLQKLGDVAIFISSLYAGALRRKPVGVAYYISMGESAYGCLADAPATSTQHRALAGIFEELSREFTSLVPALSALGRQEPQSGMQVEPPTVSDEPDDRGLILPASSMLH